MASEISVPRLGWSMEEGTFTQWLKAEGEFVRKGDLLFVLEGDKASQEIESFDEGFLNFLPQGPNAGDSVQVGQLLGYLLAKDEPPPSPAAASGTAVLPPSGTARLPPSREEEPTPVLNDGSAGASPSHSSPSHSSPSHGSPAHGSPAHGSPARVASEIATPRARRRASELGIDWRQVCGSGRNGRVRERDVVAAAPVVMRSSPSGGSVRRTIAERMLASHLQTAPVTLTTTVDASNLVALRNDFKVRALQPCPGYLDIIVKLCGMALRKHPRLNACWEANRVVEMPEVNIGIAVDTDQCLLVPVIRHVDTLSLSDVAGQSAELIELARSKRLSSQQLRGGTFTVTNLGGHGIDAFTPVINLPECAVLGVGRIARVPVVRGEQIVPGAQLTLSLTFDHRIVDGAPAARFLQELVRLLENRLPFECGPTGPGGVTLNPTGPGGVTLNPTGPGGVTLNGS